MRRCEDEKMFHRPPLLEEPCAQTLPTIGRTLRSDALGKKWFNSATIGIGRCQEHVFHPIIGIRRAQILWMEEILHQFIGGLSHYLQAFYHPRWCRISHHSRIFWKQNLGQVKQMQPHWASPQSIIQLCKEFTNILDWLVVSKSPNVMCYLGSLGPL